MCVCLYVCMYVFMYVCMYVCMRVCACFQCRLSRRLSMLANTSAEYVYTCVGMRNTRTHIGEHSLAVSTWCLLGSSSISIDQNNQAIDTSPVHGSGAVSLIFRPEPVKHLRLPNSLVRRTGIVVLALSLFKVQTFNPRWLAFQPWLKWLPRLCHSLIRLQL